MRRGFADRARHRVDPDLNSGAPVARLLAKDDAAEMRKTIDPASASVSKPTALSSPAESRQTTHLSVVEGKRNAVSLTYTFEDQYGSRIVVPGAGFLLNNERGDYNPAPGMTDVSGRIGTAPNLALPGKRPLSSMAPTISGGDGQGVAEDIVVGGDGVLEGGVDGREPDGGAGGV